MMSTPTPIDPHREITPPLAVPRHDPGPNWRVRFWAIFAGQALSLCGSALTQFVVLWWITDTTGSVSALTIAGMAALLPQALLSPLGGVFADRYSRRTLMIVGDTVSTVCMMVLIALFLTERVELWHAWTILGIRSAMQAFQMPAAEASTYMLVPESYLLRAAGFNQALQSLTVVAAAPLGAFAISIMPIGWALAIDVVTALCGIAPLLCFGIPQIMVRGKAAQGLCRDFKEGLDVVRHTPGLGKLFFLLSVTVLVVMPAFTLLPMLVKQHFGGGAAQVAMMEGLSGTGMVVASLAIAAIVPQKPIVWILVGFACSCLGIALTALVPGNLFGVAVTWWVISGICFIFGDAPLTALLQTMVPNHMQGRVLSILNTLMNLAAPVGLLIISPLGDIFGVRSVFVIAGVLGAVVSVSGFLSRDLLSLGRQSTA